MADANSWRQRRALRCFLCAGAWNAEYTRRRKWGRIIIKAMSMYLREGGHYYDLDKLKAHATVPGEIADAIHPGYERAADTIGVRTARGYSATRTP